MLDQPVKGALHMLDQQVTGYMALDQLVCAALCSISWCVMHSARSVSDRLHGAGSAGECCIVLDQLIGVA